MPWRPVGHSLPQSKGYFQSKGSTSKSSAMSHHTGWRGASAQGRMLIQGNVVFGSAHKPATACLWVLRSLCQQPWNCGGQHLLVVSLELAPLHISRCLLYKKQLKIHGCLPNTAYPCKTWSGYQNDVLGSWINRDVQMGCENSIKQVFLNEDVV